MQTQRQDNSPTRQGKGETGLFSLRLQGKCDGTDSVQQQQGLPVRFQTSSGGFNAKPVKIAGRENNTHVEQYAHRPDNKELREVCVCLCACVWVGMIRKREGQVWELVSFFPKQGRHLRTKAKLTDSADNKREFDYWHLTRVHTRVHAWTCKKDLRTA